MNEQTDRTVSNDKRNSLVIITGNRAEEAFERITADYTVRQLASSRVFVVEGGQSELAKLRLISGVTVVAAGDAPPDVLETLDEGEKLFAEAWLSQSEQGSKQRRGEGLSWDAAGFTPPDAPTTDSD